MVSIIVPVYNTEKYLDRCIKSVINQTSPDWELILIDDGSNDKSGEICRSYAQSDERIKYFKQENSGASSARNSGIKRAEGKYIYFLDSDDLVSPKLIETVVPIIEEKNLDLIYFNSNAKSESGNAYINFPVVPEYTEFENKEEMLNFVINKYLEYLINFALWNKVYRADIIKNNDITFEKKVRMGEDIGFNLKYFLYAKRVMGIEDELHEYWRREGSVMSGDSQKVFWINDFVNMLKGVKKQWKKSSCIPFGFNKVFIKAMNNQYSKKERRREFKPYVKEVEDKFFLFYHTCIALMHPFSMRKVFKNQYAKRKYKDHIFILMYLIFG